MFVFVSTFLLERKTMSTSTTDTFKAVAINEDYEWFQYNEHLRIIHSIKDDMFQAQSIVNACHSKKEANKWFNNKSTQELIGYMETSSRQIWRDTQIVENRADLPNELRGMYVHRLLVNHIAIWASPKYALDIMRLLDEHFTKQREALEKKVDDMKTRQVPKGKDKCYKYMIWIDDVPADDENDNKDMVMLHLVRRNNRTFREVSKLKNSDKCWFYAENLPIAMTPNEDVKRIIKNNLKGSEYDIKSTTVLTYKEHLKLLHEKISNYFKDFQE